MAGEATDPQAQIEQLTNQVASLNRDLGVANGERDSYRTKLRTTNHKHAFTAKAAEAKADPKAIEALWRLHGYEPDTDEPDAKAIDGLIATAREESPFAFLKDEPAPVVTDPAKPPEKLRTPAEPPRGKPPAGQAAKFQVTRKQLSNGAWMHENQQKVLEAINAGTYELVV